MTEPTILGRRLKAFRERAGLSQNELAKLARVHRPAISLLESGEQLDTTASAALRIADALGISVDMLLRDDPLSEPRPPTL